MYFWVWLESSWIWECRNEPMKEVCVHISNLMYLLWLCFRMLRHYVTHTLGWLLGCDNIPCSQTSSILVLIINNLVY